MSSDKVLLGNQRLFQYTDVRFEAGDSITNNGSWNVNKNGIGVSLPGVYIINITTSPYTSGGYNYSGMCIVYKIGDTLYCKPLGYFYGQPMMFFNSNNKKDNMMAHHFNRVLSGSKFLIGMDTNSGGTRNETANINIFHMSS